MPLTRLCFMGFNALKLLDPDPCRPFARARRGMSLGEGAGFVVLEDEAHARARGARGYAELSGYGLTTDAWHLTSPHPDGEGSVRAMAEALDRAGVPASAVGYVNAHGTGTVQNDRVEAAALRSCSIPTRCS
jgi:3-oxoacyl-[acyl-carrier-protein] synthase II